MALSDVHWLDGEKIIVEVLPADYVPHRDVTGSGKLSILALNQAVVPVPYIIDLRAINVDFGELTTALAELTRGPAAVYKHHNLKELIVVTENPMLKIGAKALTQDQYGSVKVRIVATMDEALVYARSIAPVSEH